MSTSGRGVAFAEPAAQSLLTAGKLDPRWIGAFYALPEADRGDERTWAAAFFRLRHFVSMYLPLRYAVWTRSSGKRDPGTEGLLATVINTIGETLWRGLAAAARSGAPTEVPELVHLVLGGGNPLRLGTDARVAWEHRYKAMVKEMSASWRAREAWPRWEAMALQFASFYLPLGVPSDLPEQRVDASRKRLLDEIAPHVHPDVTQVVGLWLAAAGAPRDDAGVPVVEWSPAGGRRLAGRTETEIVLLG